MIGGGKSLATHLERGDFDRLTGEVTFAMNKIHLLYELGRPTDWMPTYYVFFERNGCRGCAFEEYVTDWIARGVTCFLGDPYKMPIAQMLNMSGRPEASDNVQWLRRGVCHRTNHLSPDRPEAWHLPTLCPYGGTMNIALQLAFMLGYDPIYVLGADLGYQPEPPDLDAAPNHFHPDYWTANDFPLQTIDGTLEHMHTVARRSIERMGRYVYNAGIGGELTAYERVDLDAILSERRRYHVE